jgi:hypothetical protein
MTRPTKSTLNRRRNLRASHGQPRPPSVEPITAAEQAATVDLSSSSSETSEASGNEDEIFDFDAGQLGNDSNAEDLFWKLFEAAQTSHHEKKRVLRYTGNSSRHQRRKRKEKVVAAEGTAPLTSYFSKIGDGSQVDSDIGDDSGKAESDGEDDGKNYEKVLETIDFIEGILQEEGLSKDDIARYQSVVYFLRLISQDRFGHMEASLTVAKIYGYAESRAKFIRKWATICLKGAPFFLQLLSLF